MRAEQVEGRHDAEVRSKVEALNLTHNVSHMLSLWTGDRGQVEGRAGWG